MPLLKLECIGKALPHRFVNFVSAGVAVGRQKLRFVAERQYIDILSGVSNTKQSVLDKTICLY